MINHLAELFLRIYLYSESSVEEGECDIFK